MTAPLQESSTHAAPELSTASIPEVFMYAVTVTDQFPPRILDLLKDVADRNPPEGFGMYEDGNGEPLQDDADAALAWIAARAAPGQTLTDGEAQ